jgi:hypothetical protein
MRIPPILFGTLVIAVFLGTILGFQAVGIWSVSGKIKDGQDVQPSADDVNTIKGWMTLEQISTIYNIPLAEILTQFDLPADTPASTAIKDLESEEFSVTNLRTWLLTLPENTTPLVTPVPTTQVTSPPPVIPTETLATLLPTQHEIADKKITGKTTFQDLLDWGVPVEVIQKIIGGDLPAPATVIKDYLTQNGMEFSPIKTALQVEVDKIK